MKKRIIVLLAGLSCAVLSFGFQAGVSAQGDSIEGIVVNSTGSKPEAGVWVIAETKSLPTPYRKIVVTNDQGRFVVPALPKAEYELWVRGYGLRDSAPVKAPLGGTVTLLVASAASPQEAAKIYPANYWFSLFRPPSKEELPAEFGGSQDYWLSTLKQRCHSCHQIGMAAHRGLTRPEQLERGWKLVAGMNSAVNDLGREVLKKAWLDWTSRIAAGEVPPAPPRPTGVERNIVVTAWQWGRPDSYIHDEIATDKRNPRLYPYGKVYGVDIGQDILWALDPKTHVVSQYKVPTRVKMERRDRSYGYTAVAAPHNPMLDDKGNVWITMRIREGKQHPRWARDVIKWEGGKGPSDKVEYESTGRNLGYFDTKTEKFVLIDTAFGNHHLQFDWQGRLWTTRDELGLGMFDPSKFDPNNPYETEGKAQKHFMKFDPATGKSVAGGGYGIIVSPVDGTVWRAIVDYGPGSDPPGDRYGGANALNRFDPKTETFKDYPLPAPLRNPKGIDATTDGKIWFGTSTGHLGRFDPKTEKFTYWESPGPKVSGTGKETGSADHHYYLWVDQFNTLGLGKDMVMVTGTSSDAVAVFNPLTEKFTVIRMPYPLGMHHRGLDGRIDDEQAGWKGRGLWLNNGIDGLRLVENKIGQVVQIQLRPDPLAR